MIDELKENGFISCQLTAVDVARREVVEAAGRAFFSLSPESKAASIRPHHDAGYRPVGIEYSQTAVSPDLNESFSYWKGLGTFVTPENAQLQGALVEYQNTVERLAANAISRLRDYFRYVPRLKFERASYLQINMYNANYGDRAFFQDVHEDGHLFTLLRANKPGLEFRVNEEYVPAVCASDELLLIPGSVLTLMTGGLIPPLYHRVRAQTGRERLSVMYFVNPEIDNEILPFVENDLNRRVSIRDHAASAPERFGLRNLKDILF